MFYLEKHKMLSYLSRKSWKRTKNLVPTESHISVASFLPLPLLPLRLSCLSSSVVMKLPYMSCVLIYSQHFLSISVQCMRDFVFFKYEM